jgi:hypothetical protein
MAVTSNSPIFLGPSFKLQYADCEGSPLPRGDTPRNKGRSPHSAIMNVIYYESQQQNLESFGSIVVCASVCMTAQCHVSADNSCQ